MFKIISKSIYGFLVLVLFSTLALAQTEDTGWHLQDPAAGEVNGTGVENVYTSLVNGKKSHTVIVAIIDSGTDIYHEDLSENIWINEREIPDNGIDDDENGYIDDVNGWNFIGGKNGNVESETLEVTRLYAKYRDYFSDKDINKLGKKDKELYSIYQEYKKTIDKQRSRLGRALKNIEANESILIDGLDAFDKKYPNKKLTPAFMATFDGGDDEQLQVVQQIFSQVDQLGVEVESIDELKQEIYDGYAEAKKDFSNRLNYWYNPDYNSREIVGVELLFSALFPAA